MNRDYNTSNDKVTNALNNMSKSLKSLAETATVQIELPKINSNDPGKVLTVVGSGEDVRWDKAEPATELPEVTSEDAGDVLTVNSDGEWVKSAPATELPEVTSSDNSKVLGVVDGEWATTNGGTVVLAESARITATGNVETAINITISPSLVRNKVYKARLILESSQDVYEYAIRFRSGPPASVALVYTEIFKLLVSSGTDHLSNISISATSEGSITANVTLDSTQPVTFSILTY